MVNHVISERSKLAPKKNKTSHRVVGKGIVKES